MRIKIDTSLAAERRSDRYINFFIAGLLFLPLYIKFMGALSGIFFFSTKITTYFGYGTLWVLLLLGLPAILGRITQNVIAAAAGVGIWLVLSVFANPESMEFVWKATLFDLATFNTQSLLHTVLLLFVGMAVSDFDHLRRVLHMVARVGLVTGVLNYSMLLISDAGVHYDDMAAAYAVCTMLCLLIADWKKKDGWFAVLGLLCLFVSGTRGPFVCVLVAWLLKYMRREQNKFVLLAMILGAVAVVFLLYSGVAEFLLLALAEVLSNFGVTDLRIIDYMSAGMLLDDSGRDNFWAYVLEAIMRKPLLGYGIGGDRILLLGHYVHNMIYEAVVSLGVVPGIAFLAWVAWLSIRGIRSQNGAIKSLTVGLFSCTVVKLMMSSSVILSYEFFLFLGICLAAGRKYRQEGI